MQLSRAWSQAQHGAKYSMERNVVVEPSIYETIEPLSYHHSRRLCWAGSFWSRWRWCGGWGCPLRQSWPLLGSAPLGPPPLLMRPSHSRRTPVWIYVKKQYICTTRNKRCVAQEYIYDTQYKTPSMSPSNSRRTPRSIFTRIQVQAVHRRLSPSPSNS